MKKTSIFKIGFILLIVLISGVGFFVLKNKSIIPPSDILSERCQQKDSPYLDSGLSVQERVNDLMKRMNDWEKIGQMILIEKNSIHDLNDITRYNLGALLSGGGAGPKQNTPLAWLQMVNSFQSAAKNTCLGIPLLYGTDATHGHGNVFGATIFPHF
ncbi:MAG: glycoside hydrolase family 3 N-terminal domain-containing protein, partial [bacterium]|nr:glycoside hydrolase family 3 N-terminal domain-containing protein [bacterium]